MKTVYIPMDDFPMAEKTVIVTVNSKSHEIVRGQPVDVEDNIAQVLYESHGAIDVTVHKAKNSQDKVEAPKKKSNRKKK